MITYLDRACFGSAAPTLAGELGLGDVAGLKWAFTSFTIAYSVFEIPSAWLGDTLGPRGTLVRIVIWWSTFTALTALVGLKVGTVTIGSLGALVVLRFLFGVGEAGAYPNITRAVHNWFPLHEWNMAQGLVWMSGRLMGGLTPLIWTVLVTGTAWTPALVAWRGAFVLLGLVGLLWCFGFAKTFRNHPAEHPQINEAELATIEGGAVGAPLHAHGSIPWRAFLTNRNLWLVCLMYFCVNFGWIFNITYLPNYLQERYQLDKTSVVVALYKGAPLWFGAAACLTGGLVISRLIRRTGNRRRVRRIIGAGCLSCCALCWWLAMAAPNVHLFCLTVSLAAFLSDLTLASAWATCQEIGGRYAGVTAAFMNTIGTLGSVLNGWLTGTLVERSVAERAQQLDIAVASLPATERHTAMLAGYDIGFMTYFAAYAVAALCWTLIDSTKPIVVDTDADAQPTAS
ncbi:MAG: MFS transporter [Planctomycetia bacterium]|nr:MFS transporter [Planctomycetia bacterium]